MLHRLHIEAKPQFEAEYEAIGAAMHQPGPFWTLAHCDAGPHNVLLPHDSAVLIDFEFGQYACCLMDMVSARMGFPHAYKGQRIPPQPLRQMEQAYRQELAQHIPQATDDHLLGAALAQACAAWALGRLSNFWKGYLKAYLTVGEAANANRKATHVTLMRQWQMTYIQAVIETTAEFDCLPVTRQVMQRVQSALLGLWPDLTSLPYYPVFGSQTDQ